MSFDPALASPTIFSDVLPSFAPLSSVAHSVLLSWLHDEQRLLVSHGDRLTSLLASTNSHLDVVSDRHLCDCVFVDM